MKLGEHGQGTGAIATVVAVVGVMITAWIGVHILSNVEGGLPSKLGGTTTSYVTLNADLSDNTGNVPDNWDNLTEPAASGYITNAWNASEYLTTTRDTAAGDNFENGAWYQALTVSSIYDEVSTATLSFKWRLIDNDNIEAIYIRVYLCDGTDNTLIFEDNSIENTATWNTQENSVTSVVDAAGTYVVYLRSEIDPDDANVPNVVVGWDDASLSVSAYSRSYADNSFSSIQKTGWGGYPLIGVVVIILVAALIIGLMVRFGGSV